MLTIIHPQVAPFVESLPVGVWSLLLRNEPEPRLIIKTVKEMLLTAKLNLGFKVYVSPLNLSGQNTIGLIFAFFDDEDEPLVIFTPVFDDEESRRVLHMFQRETLEIHLFDELSREFLGYTCDVNLPPDTRQRITSSSLCPFALDLARSANIQMTQWFGLRTSDDDLAAISVAFGESHFADDLVILDARPANHLYPGSRSFSFSQLERKEPGPFQELDIAHLLGRLFEPTSIFMNPLQVTDKQEISDLLVLTESDIIVLQAKDTPNIEKVLRNTVGRKRLTAQKALLKAVSQVKGALRYLRSMSPAKLIVAGELKDIDIGNRQIRALIVLKELFSDEYSIYSPSIIELSKETGVPCIALDYSELVEYTEMSSQKKFFEAFDLVYEQGQKAGVFPRLRIWRVSEEENVP